METAIYSDYACITTQNVKSPVTRAVVRSALLLGILQTVLLIALVEH